MFSRRTFYKARYEVLFIGLSVLLLVGIGLLPKSPNPSSARDNGSNGSNYSSSSKIVEQIALENYGKDLSQGF